MKKPTGPKRGRPSKDLAGDVQARILDAAQQLFLEKGYRSASIDDISEMAPASKPTIYAHFPGKEALFAAVVARTISGLTDFEGFTPEGRTIEDKLMSLGTVIIERVFEESLGMVRATIAEAPRFPELSRNVHDAARDRSLTAVSQLLNDATQKLARAPKGPFSAKRSRTTAQIFLDLILLPMLFRSLLGETPKDLKKELSVFLRERVGFFLAACETDWSHQSDETEVLIGPSMRALSGSKPSTKRRLFPIAQPAKAVYLSPTALRRASFAPPAAGARRRASPQKCIISSKLGRIPV